MQEVFMLCAGQRAARRKSGSRVALIGRSDRRFGRRHKGEGRQDHLAPFVVTSAVLQPLFLKRVPLVRVAVVRHCLLGPPASAGRSDGDAAASDRTVGRAGGAPQ